MMDGQMDGWMDGRMDGLIRYINSSANLLVGVMMGTPPAMSR